MNTIGNLKIWKTHKSRNYELNNCPYCEKPLKWIYDGMNWLPCDKEPVLFIMHPEGNKSVVYKKEIIEHCLIYRPGDKRFSGNPLQGNQQHYYTCEYLKKLRREYAKAMQKRR